MEGLIFLHSLETGTVFVMKQSEVSIAKYCLVIILTSVIYI